MEIKSKKRKGGIESPTQQNAATSHTFSTLLSPISPSVLSDPSELRQSYLESKPFKHGCLTHFCKDGFLEQVLEEVKQNSTVKFKESDLFKMYQTVDLGNLKDDSELAQKMPLLMKLKHALYSSEFRSFIENMSALEPGTLTDQVDCAANCHTNGCHLLCHDDVIGNRKISYILYLTDPKEKWTDEDGGRLELYESELDNEKRVPMVFPCKTMLPTFNSLVFFAVTPGESFHSVQEVFCDNPRLSIQGWYHAKVAPSNLEEATLCRLKSTGKCEETEGDFLPYASNHSNTAAVFNEAHGVGDECLELANSDRAFLSTYINEIYLTQKSIDEIRERFEEDSSVQLRNFVKDDLAKKIQEAALIQDNVDKLGKKHRAPALKYDIGVCPDWKAVGPAHKQRFLEYVGSEVSEGENIGGLLKHLKCNVFSSLPFRRYLCCLTSLGEATGYRGRVRRFRPGLDYTVAHYGLLTTTAVLDSTLCFASGHGKQCIFDEDTGEVIGTDEDDDVLWESGDVGGFECYISADDDEKEPAEEYDAEGDTELLSVAISNNTFSLVYRDPGTLRFVKYVGSRAPSSRWDLSLEYEIPDDEETSVASKTLLNQE